VTHQELASAVSLTRVSVTRLLKILSSRECWNVARGCSLLLERDYRMFTEQQALPQHIYFAVAEAMADSPREDLHISLDSQKAELQYHLESCNGKSSESG
jgi:hypothetical protein